MPESWRIFMICSIAPLADSLVGALRELGHEPVALLAPRRDRRARAAGAPHPHRRAAPQGLDLLFARDKHAIEPLLRAYEPDLMICWGFPWKIPQAALDVPRLGSVNCILRCCRGTAGRSRSPGRCVTATPSGAARGTAWTPSSTPATSSRRARSRSTTTTSTSSSSRRSCRRAPSRCCRARSSGWRPAIPATRSRPRERAGPGHFEDDDYVRVDWIAPARSIHNQVRAWHLTFGISGLRAPVADLDGEQVVLLQTRLTDPGGGARRVECGDGPIWVVASEPV